MTAGIYQIRHLESDKVYIGSTKNLTARKWRHFWELKNSRHHNPHLQKAYNKYGVENFVFEILEVVSDEKTLIASEQKWFDMDKPFFNICQQADSVRGVKRSEAYREQKRVWATGRRHSDETRALIAEKATGRVLPPVSESARRNISAALTGLKKSPAHVVKMRDFRHTEASKRKTSESKKAQGCTPALAAHLERVRDMRSARRDAGGRY